jgi:N-acetylglucosaminyldiphosphoundecaprenol N-acetyl-beta-D-mannosaminyltransferase
VVRIKSVSNIMTGLQPMSSKETFRKKVELFGLDIDALTFKDSVDALAAAAVQQDGRAKVVVTPNVDHIVRLDANPEFKALYAQADFMFADGMPVVWASKLVDRPVPERVTGADLFVSLCQRAQEQGWQVVILGGDEHREASIRQGFATHYPRLRVEIISPSMRYDPFGAEAQEHADRIRALAPQVVFVCLGMPKQEQWAFRYAPTLPGGIVLCAGMAMMFAIGMQRRAPKWMQRSGTEWLWRLASEPRRMAHRYLVQDTKYFKLVWELWRNRKN